eukprot:TRINITY_DN18989_c0_g1_i1.p1 TRINITY_DN18989_c0_g1~~TRINITY_DN18989_c0_g1_i1.p1  ORF type:complete len:550 (-),score=85.25 TRINITY_DN18989_c0_g1_i1:136-1731(-)
MDLRSRFYHFCIAFVYQVAFSSVAYAALGPQCQSYLSEQNLGSPSELLAKLDAEELGGKCSLPTSPRDAYTPDPRPGIAGATDTSDLACRHGNPSMYNSGGACCGWRPHFNWVVSTCETNEKLSTSKFCKVPECVVSGSPKINYVAAYQFNGSHFVMLDESTAGETSSEGVSGSYHDKTGWEKVKSNFSWLAGAGDWTSKYAPWGEGAAGPRGVTPPGALWILSAENFYYAGFYMLSQLNLNMQGAGNPQGTPCWVWEFDPVEGTVGWMPDGEPLPGNLNQLYATNNAAPSGCMPVAYTAAQANGLQRNFTYPTEFQSFCAANPSAAGCDFWAQGGDVWWSGSVEGSQRFENLWDEAYVFAVVIDKRGVWIYRWRPDEEGATGWPGVSRFSSRRVLPARPKPVKDVKGLATDVAGHVKEALIFQPSLLPEESCLMASKHDVNWQFGSDALGAMAYQLDKYGPGSDFEGAQNWWAHFADTAQHDPSYPLSLAGVPKGEMNEDYTCNVESGFSCQCEAPARLPNVEEPGNLRR